MFGFHKTKDNFVACPGDISLSVELFYEAVWRQGAWGDGATNFPPSLFDYF
jgi:hypothetical protein